MKITKTKHGCRLSFDAESNPAIIKKKKTIIDLTQKEMAQISIALERAETIAEIMDYFSNNDTKALTVYADKYDDSGNAVTQLADKVREIRIGKENSNDITKAINELIKD